MRLLPIIFLLLLSGCGSAPVYHRAPASSARASQEGAEHHARLPEKTQRPRIAGGGYYLDDGPGDNPPANIDAIPDAVPRAEHLIVACNRPYTALGKTYTPETTLAPYHAEGIASWYGRRYNGQKTSSGEIYDMYAMTAAHPTLPIPSYARVENPANGKSVIVRINDRGPFRSDRLIDLSYSAAYKLGILQNGSSRVVVESILPDDEGRFEAAAPAAPKEESLPIAHESSGIYLQLGAFSGRDNAESFLSKIKPQLLAISAPVDIASANGLYKVHAGPFSSREEALATAEKIEQNLEIRPVIVH